MLARIAFLISLLLILPGCAANSTRVETPDELILYSLDGRDFAPGEEPKTNEKFHNVPVLGKLVVADAARRRKVISTLHKGLAESDGSIAKCFWPRHGIRAVGNGKKTDYVICFQCVHAIVHEDNKAPETRPLTRTPKKLFNQLLKDAGIPLAPGAETE